MRPTCDWASIAPRNIKATDSIFSRFHESASAALLAMRWVSLSITVSMIFRWFALSELPVSVTSTIASASMGGFTSVAPQLNSTLTLTPLIGKVTFADLDQFCGNDFAFEVFGLLKAARLGHGQYPAHFAPALLGISERGDAGHVKPAFNYPVDAGESRIEDAMIDIARHLLRANQHAFDLAIVDGWEIRPAIGVDVPARALEESDCRILKAALGNAEP